MHSDNAETLDEGSMVALIMLDLSAAYDVIDHPTLLKCISYQGKKPLILAISYFIDRPRCVSIVDET